MKLPTIQPKTPSRDQLNISEDFFSVQAEGATTGVPAYFVRLRGCNLLCGNPDMRSVYDKTNQDEIDAAKDSDATWVCDSIAVWLHGRRTPHAELEGRFAEAGQLENILEGRTHLIWTGGEPSLPHHRRSIMSFTDYLTNKHPGASLYTELETNGTQVIEQPFARYINQINCSPKLSNSAMPLSRRFNKDALESIQQHPNHYFKFVVSTEDDVLEAKRDFIEPLSIPHRNVILMPGVNSQADMPERTQFLYEMSKKHGYRGVTRGHVIAWDKVTGV